MKRTVLIAIGGAALIGAALYALSNVSAQTDRIVLRDADPETVARGASVYAANCASCHGANLEGQANWRSPGEDGRLPAPPHDETGHTWHHDGDTLFRLTKYGVGALIKDPDYATNMPNYEDVLSDEDIIAVLSYIKSTWPEDVRARHNDMESRQ
ncbi:Cytochrome C oxidase, cbb3-type, subunit III [Cognatiyoonia koreensis]|uniref:Cytochrome C oxidase, cbb3-type, subunit III n=1 Tax=Cognatiyoonia koreensis TaxID=364200 RepID=A0A1I0RZZ1_9RHOB|nr:cytochrome c [Cognatiyoonia koreensis]SEW47178.1 Cytochrome C oxidase, cbb3-type, subunit III [Cognatiyoonia koreensis]